MELRRSTRFAVSKPTLDASAAKRATNETRDIAAPVNDQNGSHASQSSELGIAPGALGSMSLTIIPAARTNLGNVTARVTEVHDNARLTCGSSCDTGSSRDIDGEEGSGLIARSVPATHHS
jgi:hypothetical protein